MYDLEDIRRHGFVEHGRASFKLKDDGPLSGLSFAAKDLMDVAGFKSGWGNPDRLRDAAPAVATTPAVLACLMAGAQLVGKTHTDEVACGMFGMNPHFGIPINPKAPTRVPGGCAAGLGSPLALWAAHNAWVPRWRLRCSCHSLCLAPGSCLVLG